MALTVNGIKVAGIGLPGKSSYQSAVDAGYSGSESDFNEALAQIAYHIIDEDNPHRVSAEQLGVYTIEQTDEAMDNLKKEIGVQYAFNVDANGHLIMSYTTGDTPPNVAINDEGHLILTI